MRYLYFQNFLISIKLFSYKLMIFLKNNFEEILFININLPLNKK